MKNILAIAFSLSVASTGEAQTLVSGAPVPVHSYAEVKELEVPVVDGDITDKPYRVLGDIEAGVRKATLFSKSPSHEKVYRELWERGKKMGADAVINAGYGEARVTVMSWGSRKATGKAIKFLTDAEIAAQNSAPAATSTSVAAPAPAEPAVTPGPSER